MGTLGTTLKEARERKGATASEAAAATRIKVQHIESMEQEDFSKIAAAAYARGFIKLYAEYLELDPAPLVQEYNEQYALKGKPPSYIAEKPKRKVRKRKSDEGSRWAEYVARARVALKNTPAWISSHRKGVLGVALLILILFSLSRCGGPGKEPAGIGREPGPGSAWNGGSVIQEPPEPYITIEPRE